MIELKIGDRTVPAELVDFTGKGGVPKVLEIGQRGADDNWGYTIEFVSPSSPTGGFMAGGALAGPDNYAQTHAQLLKDMEFYSSEGRRLVKITIRRACPICGGSGNKPYKGRFNPLRIPKGCAKCKGSGTAESVTISYKP